MSTKLAVIAVAALLVSPVAVFAAEDAFSPEIEAQVRAMLVEQGYEVRKIDFEDGLYEAYAIKDGKRMEVLVTADLEILPEGEVEDND